MTYEIVTVRIDPKTLTKRAFRYETRQTYTLAYAVARDLAKRTLKRVEIRTHNAAEAVGRYY